MATLIESVDGKPCPCPSSCTFELNDVSASDAGRVEDGDATMYKNRICQKRKLDLVWNAKTPEEATTILQMFNPEYIKVTYYDVLDGQTETREFYVGDRSLPVKQWFVNSKLYASVSFNIIER